MVLASPWYLVNWKYVWEYTLQASYGDLAKVYRFGTSLNDLKALWFYLSDFLNTGITAYQGMLFLALGSVYLIWWQKREMGPFSLNSVGVILWFVFPFVIFLPSLYRNFKFMMPFFAPLSIGLGIMMWRLVKDFRWGWFIVVILLIWPNFGILYASFPLGGLNQPYHSIRIGSLEFLPQKGYLKFPQRGRWPYREILEYAACDGAHIKIETGKFPSLGMVVDMNEFNRNVMLYEAVKTRLPVRVFGAPLGGLADPKYDLSSALVTASQHDYLVFRSPCPTDPEFTNKFNDEIRRRTDRGELPFKLVKEFPLPDGTKAFLYRHLTTFGSPP